MYISGAAVHPIFLSFLHGDVYTVAHSRKGQKTPFELLMISASLSIPFMYLFHYLRAILIALHLIPQVRS